MDSTIWSFLFLVTLLYVLLFSSLYAVRNPWNLQGPTGQAFDDSITGTTGATGLNGLPGLRGFTGTTGILGLEGPTGISTTGWRGIIGNAVFRGPTGPTGPTGYGFTGAGDQGPTGHTGPTGSIGPMGITGSPLISNGYAYCNQTGIQEIIDPNNVFYPNFFNVNLGLANPYMTVYTGPIFNNSTKILFLRSGVYHLSHQGSISGSFQNVIYGIYDLDTLELLGKTQVLLDTPAPGTFFINTNVDLCIYIHAGTSLSVQYLVTTDEPVPTFGSADINSCFNAELVSEAPFL
jgi:hypothetical protein